MKLLILTLASMAALCTQAPSAQAQAVGETRVATNAERASFEKFLYSLNGTFDYQCFRNLNNYRSIGVLREAIQKNQTFVDSKSGDVYNEATLRATLPVVRADFPKETTLRHVGGDVYSFEYELRFKAISGNSDFTEMKFAQDVPGIVRHVFERRNGRYEYRQSSYDLVRGSKQGPMPHVRCAIVREVEEPGVLWGTNKVHRLMPLEGVELRAQRCKGTPENCREIPREPLIVRD